MATNNENENKRGIILFISILVILLLLFIGIRACSNKKVDSNKKKDDGTPIEDVIIDDNEDEDENETLYVASTSNNNTAKVTKAVAKTEEEVPVLTLELNGNSTVEIEYKGAFSDDWVNAFDTKEGDLSQSVVKTVYLNDQVVDTIDTNNAGATYTIKYVVTNSRGETKTVTRTVKIKVPDVYFSLKGQNPVPIEYNTSNPTNYNDAGVEATLSTDGSDISGSTNTTITKDGQVYTGDVSSSEKGEYIYTYTLEYNNKTYTETRTVTVEDTTDPEVTSVEDSYEYLLDANGVVSINDITSLFSYSDQDSNLTATLADENGNPLTADISKATVGEYPFTMNVEDTAGNIGTKTITIKIVEDTTAPTFNVNSSGSPTLTGNIGNRKMQFTYAVSNINDDYTDSGDVIIEYSTDGSTWTRLNGNNIQISLNTTYSYRNWEYTSVAATLYVRATDNSNNTSDITQINIDPYTLPFSI